MVQSHSSWTAEVQARDEADSSHEDAMTQQGSPFHGSSDGAADTLSVAGNETAADQVPAAQEPYPYRSGGLA